MPWVRGHDQLLAGTLGRTVNIERRREIAFHVRTASIALLSAEHVVRREKDNPRAYRGSSLRHMKRSQGIDGKGQRGIGFAIIDAVKSSGVENPQRFVS